MAKPSKYVQNLRRFLRQKGSPLARYAKLIAQTEARNGIPAGMIAAIAGAETSWGTAGSGPRKHNYWGWMTSAGPPNQRGFSSTAAAIRQYGKFLGDNYIKAGYNTPEKMMNRYVGYPSSNWLGNVNSTLRSLGVGGNAPPSAPTGRTGTPRPGKPGKGPQSALAGLQALPMPQKIAFAMLMSSGDDDMMDMMLPLLATMRTATPPQPQRPRRTAQTTTGNVQMYSGNGLLLPVNHSSTHPTSGLSGYPAFDFMEAAGTPVYAPFTGTVTRLSGHPDVRGSTFGRSIYIKGPPGSVFLTHFDWNKTIVKEGDKVKKGQLIGYVGDWGPRSHIHMGATWW